MAITVSHPTRIVKGAIQLTSSKSESNRALIIQSLCDDHFNIHNISEADDTIVLQKLLQTKELELNVGLAGTAMRFLTALKSIDNGECVLTGAERMKERPIKILVDALRELGSDIKYLEKEGFPPLKIIGQDLKGGQLSLDGNVSSQYISALLMIAPQLRNGLKIHFKGEIISKPYIDMTINMMQYFGAHVFWEEDVIVVEEGQYVSRDYVVEADWSAASYWYSLVALSTEADVVLYGLNQKSLQGDSVIADIYKNFGVETTFIEGGIRITKICHSEPVKETNFKFDFTNCPDIAQTVAVTCAALNVKAQLTGLKTLRIKETDRITALQTELNNLGCHVEVDRDDLLVNRHSCESRNLSDWSDKNIKTYNDHRMAMAFAPLALINEITIENPEVVKKSYPKFWEDMKNVGMRL